MPCKVDYQSAALLVFASFYLIKSLCSSWSTMHSSQIPQFLSSRIRRHEKRFGLILEASWRKVMRDCLHLLCCIMLTQNAVSWERERESSYSEISPSFAGYLIKLFYRTAAAALASAPFEAQRIDRAAFELPLPSLFGRPDELTPRNARVTRSSRPLPRARHSRPYGTSNVLSIHFSPERNAILMLILQSTFPRLFV